MKKILKPLKYKKRIVGGINEVKRTLETNRGCRMIIIAINVQENPFVNSQSYWVEQIVRKAKERGVDVVYSNTRANLGLAFTGNTKVRVSVISIINAEGFEGRMEQVLSIYKGLKE